MSSLVVGGVRRMLDSPWSLIEALRGSRCPTAVLGRVRSVVVDALNREQRVWAPPHISQEILEAVAPAITDNDSAPSVVGEVVIQRIMTTGLHRLPDHVLRHRARAFRSVDTGPMRGHNLAGPFAREAATGVGITAAKIPARDGGHCPAIASAQPPNFSVSGRSLRDHHQASEALTGQITKDWHRSIKSTLLRASVLCLS